MSKLPSSFPKMGASFKKPYTEFEFNGKIYHVPNTIGGHNGVGQRACIAHPPIYDPVRRRWVVHVDNNLIHIDFSDQPQAATVFGEDSPLKRLVIRNNPDPATPSSGVLVSKTSDPDAEPEYPVDCEFLMMLLAEAPGLPALVTRSPLRLVAEDLEVWPPPVGTTYVNPDGVDFFLEQSESEIDEPLARILPGDSTILTEVFTLDE